MADHQDDRQRGGSFKGVCKVPTKRSAITAQARARVYNQDFYADGNLLFCRFCQHSVDHTRVDTLKDHLKSQKHEVKKKKSQESQLKIKQVTLDGKFTQKSMQARQSFVEDFIRACTLADIPLFRAEKLRPFLKRYCSQGGALPQQATLRTLYVPRVYDSHIKAVLENIKSSVKEGFGVQIIADETTDHRDKSVLNIVANVKGRCFLIDCHFLEATNNVTLSQHIVKTINSCGLGYGDILSFVTDGAAYCRKAYRDVLAVLFPKSVYVVCWAHIVNLVADVWAHPQNPIAQDVATLITFMKSVFFKKLSRKRRYLTYLTDHGMPAVLCPEPVQTRWNTWLEAAMYHADHIHLYEEFLRDQDSKAMAIERCLSILTDQGRYQKVKLLLAVIKDTAPKITSLITSLEDTASPLAPFIYDKLTDFSTWLQRGSVKVVFGESDVMLDNAPLLVKRDIINAVHAIFEKSLEKFSRNFDTHPALVTFKACRALDPRALSRLSHRIEDYAEGLKLDVNDAALLDERDVYMDIVKDNLPNPLDLNSFWCNLSGRLPKLSTVAKKYIWLVVSSVDTERSFSDYKNLVTDKRECLTEESTKQLCILHFNGDIEGCFES